MYDPNDQKEILSQILAQVEDVDERIYSLILQMHGKQNNNNWMGFLSDNENLRHLEKEIQQKEDSTQEEKEQRMDVMRNNLKLILNVIVKIKDHDFNKQDYCDQRYLEQRQNLIERIREQKGIIRFLKFLVHLTAYDEYLIQCGTNSLNLLVSMKVDIRSQNFENIRIKNTSLLGANFARCNLSGSQLDNVDINGMNLNGALLLNCRWTNIKKEGEIYELNGHTNIVNFVCFSPDGNILASGSTDESIRLWDVKTGQLKNILDCSSGTVKSLCFSPDGTTLASGSYGRIGLWDVKTGQLKNVLDCRRGIVLSVWFSPDGTTLASGSTDKSICLWDVQTGQQKAKFIVVMFIHYASLLMVLHQHLVELISLSGYGMLKQDNQRTNWMVIGIQSTQYASHLTMLYQHLVVVITLSVYGILRQDYKRPNLMVIVVSFYQYASLLMILDLHLIVVITLFVYGMENQEKKFNLKIKIINIFDKNQNHFGFGIQQQIIYGQSNNLIYQQQSNPIQIEFNNYLNQLQLIKPYHKQKFTMELNQIRMINYWQQKVNTKLILYLFQGKKFCYSYKLFLQHLK
ncbi:unnamed protein product [Paramecium pentaurelia]|uniref:Uncharacterized protein n=1 Tax=Paramecium pentaurelia TaxID=43138 RepID=A0A8S1V0Q2_9CILI|nr:unnamed protein product [Paramecium pentaurelia]